MFTQSLYISQKFTTKNLLSAITICLQKPKFKHLPSLKLLGVSTAFGFNSLSERTKKRTSYPGKILEIYKNTRNIYLMLRVFLAFVVLGNKLQHLEPNKNQPCTFLLLSLPFITYWQNHLHLWSETLFSDRKTRCSLSELIDCACILTFILHILHSSGLSSLGVPPDFQTFLRPW